MKINLFLLAIVAILTGCEKENGPGSLCNAIQLTKIEGAKAEYHVGETLELGVNIQSEGFFQWSSSTYPPLNSNSDKILISNISKKHEGTYYLSVSSGECETKRDSVVIKVVNPPASAPCSPQMNTVTFDGIPDSGPFSVDESYDVSFQTRKLRGYYQLYYPDLTVLFHQYWKDIEPEDGEYKLVHVSETANRDDPYVINITTLYQSVYFTSLGKAYVSHPNGKLTVTFCDAEFSGDSGGYHFKTNGSGSISRP